MAKENEMRFFMVSDGSGTVHDRLPGEEETYCGVHIPGEWVEVKSPGIICGDCFIAYPAAELDGRPLTNG